MEGGGDMTTTLGQPTPFQARARHHAAQSWRALARTHYLFYGVPKRARQAQPTGEKVAIGCLSFLVFGWITILLPLLFALAVDAVVFAYALVVSLVWLASLPFGGRRAVYR
jgi:hypothetical protein